MNIGGYRYDSVHGSGYVSTANNQPIVEEGTYTDEYLPVRLFEDVRVRNDDILPHIHKAIEILCICTGELEIAINSTHYLMPTGSVALINSYDTHMITGANARYYVIQLEPDIFKVYGIEVENYFPSESNKVLFPEIDITSDLRRIVYRIFDRKPEVSSEETEYERLELVSEIMRLFSIIIKEFRTDDEKEQMIRYDWKTASRVKEIFQYVDAHYSEEISLDDISQQVHLTRNYFCRFFRQSTGMTFNDYLNSYRCQRAEELMRNSEMTITAIAEEVGYSNVAYFNRIYRKLRGETPSKNRKQFSQEKLSEEII